MRGLSSPICLVHRDECKKVNELHAHFDNKVYLTIIKDCSCNGNVYVQSVYLTGSFESLPTFEQVSPTIGSRCCIAMGSGAVGVHSNITIVGRSGI